MKRAIKILAALGLSVSMLTACGGSSQTGSEGQAGSESQPVSENQSASGEKVTDVSEMYTVTLAYIGNEQADIPRIHMACGTEDFLLEVNRDYYAFLKENNVDVSYEEDPGSHEWDFWEPILWQFLNHWLLK